jgi:hypothetical protein
MRMLVPEGTGAITVSNWGTGSALFGGQAEVTLERGLSLTVVADHGVAEHPQAPQGIRMIDVMVEGGGDLAAASLRWPWEMDVAYALELNDSVARASAIEALAKAQARDRRGRFAGGGGDGGAGAGEAGGEGAGGGGAGGGGGEKTPAMLHDDEATIRGVYNYHDERTGLSARVDTIRSQGPGFSTYVSGSILDRDGNTVGGFERDIRPANQATVSHGGLVLHRNPGGEEVQGQGFATRYNAKTEVSYREHGIKRIELNANIDVGGYAWAKAGYQFSDSYGRQNVIDRATIHKIVHPNPKVNAQIDRVMANRRSSPIDFAMIGYEPGLSVWPGKMIMLGSNWGGYKDLT